MNNISQILTNNINIREITYDFNNYKIKHNTFFKNKEHEMKIRYENLHDIINILNKHNIEYWLQGKTMLGISKYGQLIKNDSNNSIGHLVRSYYREESGDLAGAIEDLEKEAIIRTLKFFKNNRRASAKSLGMSERTLYRKINFYGLERKIKNQ